MTLVRQFFYTHICILDDKIEDYFQHFLQIFTILLMYNVAFRMLVSIFSRHQAIVSGRFKFRNVSIVKTKNISNILFFSQLSVL